MAQFVFQKTELEDALLIKNETYEDFRGDFTKIYEKHVFEDENVNFRVNENCFIHSKENVWRGLHFQSPKAQARLITVCSGRIYNVMLDLRKESKTYLRWQGITLCRGEQCLYVPQGFANGFLALEDSVILCQNCGEYDFSCEMGIRYDDPVLDIQFPVPTPTIICSEKDKRLMSLQQYLEIVNG